MEFVTEFVKGMEFVFALFFALVFFFFFTAEKRLIPPKQVKKRGQSARAPVDPGRQTLPCTTKIFPNKQAKLPNVRFFVRGCGLVLSRPVIYMSCAR